MTLEELSRSETLQLPKSVPRGKYFVKYFEETLNEFLKCIESLKEDFHFDSIEADHEFVVNVQRRTVTRLIQVVREYYNGHPSKAYNELSQTLSNEQKELHKITRVASYEPESSFYRIRLGADNYPFRREELFHIPFEKRGNVATQRFSIPGFPTLYLGRTLYVCWEELERPKMDNFHCSRLANTRKLRLLDLSPLVNVNHRSKSFYRYIMTWPIILACSIKVSNTHDYFKPEYIVPQLLLQWIRENQSTIDGVMYKSTHISSELYNADNEACNIAIPVRTVRDKGYCSNLSSSFKMTDVISWGLHQFSSGGKVVLYTKEALKPIDKKLPRLKIFSDREFPYSYSTLGKLEHLLDGMPLYSMEEVKEA